TPTNIKMDDLMAKKAGGTNDERRTKIKFNNTNDETRTTKFDDTSNEEEPPDSTLSARKNQRRTSELDDTSNEERINEKEAPNLN
ncbi:2208_t:CDS:1, partial [Racocetra fulgida]